MTRIHGQLFEDGRNGSLFIHPTQAFFGCDRHDKTFNVQDGHVDFELMPTPPGIKYLVGFKEDGDFRRVAYTLEWRVQNTAEIDITPNKPVATSDKPRSSNRRDLIQVKRLASELAASMQKVSSLEQELESAHRELARISTLFEQFKAESAKTLILRDEEINNLQTHSQPEVRTIVKEVPLPPEQLQARIKFLESELLRTQEVNSQYYLSVLELHQLKLNKAQTVQSSAPVSTSEDSPRQRLLNKLWANQI